MIGISGTIGSLEGHCSEGWCTACNPNTYTTCLRSPIVSGPCMLCGSPSPPTPEPRPSPQWKWLWGGGNDETGYLDLWCDGFGTAASIRVTDNASSVMVPGPWAPNPSLDAAVENILREYQFGPHGPRPSGAEWSGRFEGARGDRDPRGIPACPSCDGIQPEYASKNLDPVRFAKDVGHRLGCKLARVLGQMTKEAEGAAERAAEAAARAAGRV